MINIESREHGVLDRATFLHDESPEHRLAPRAGAVGARFRDCGDAPVFTGAVPRSWRGEEGVADVADSTRASWRPLPETGPYAAPPMLRCNELGMLSLARTATLSSMSMPRSHIRFLAPGDEALAENFLRTRPETTMILRSNLARVGLNDEGKTFQGTYAGAFDEGTLVGLAARYFNGNLVLAGGAHVAALTEALAPRGLRGILGVKSEVAAARRVAEERFGAVVHRDASEILYALSLSDLVVPETLSRLIARTPSDDEMSLILDWRMLYCAETSGVPDTPEERSRQGQLLRAFHADGHDVLVFDGATPVAYSGFNATLPDMVQVGGVYTPPELRGRGYARSAVAATLASARARKVERAILFTPEDNLAAQRAYLALGFQPIGDYAIVVFE